MTSSDVHLNPFFLFVPEEIVKNTNKMDKFQYSKQIDRLFQKNVSNIQYLYMQNSRIVFVSLEVWKCFRCNLTFKEETHAKLHEEISKHSVRSEKLIEA